MKCPIQFTLAYSTGGVLSTPSRDCLREECAWWNNRFDMCSQAVSAYLRGVEDRAKEVKTRDNRD